MKRVVAALALANVGFFLWHGVGGFSRAPDPAATRAAVAVASAPGAAGAALPAAAPRPQSPSASLAAVMPALAPSNDTASPDSGGAAPAGADPPADGPTFVKGVVPEDAPPAATGAKRCVSIGPFRDVAEAARAASSLRIGGYSPRQRVGDARAGEPGYVYWIDVVLKPWNTAPRTSSLQSEDARAARLQLRACPAASGAAS